MFSSYSIGTKQRRTATTINYGMYNDVLTGIFIKDLMHTQKDSTEFTFNMRNIYLLPELGEPFKLRNFIKDFVNKFIRKFRRTIV